jgi:hypothetical protein
VLRPGVVVHTYNPSYSGESWFKVSPGKNIIETLPQQISWAVGAHTCHSSFVRGKGRRVAVRGWSYPKKLLKQKGLGCSPNGIVHLSNKPKALSTNPSTSPSKVLNTTSNWGTTNQSQNMILSYTSYSVYYQDKF